MISYRVLDNKECVAIMEDVVVEESVTLWFVLEDRTRYESQVGEVIS